AGAVDPGGARDAGTQRGVGRGAETSRKDRMDHANAIDPGEGGELPGGYPALDAVAGGMPAIEALALDLGEQAGRGLVDTDTDVALAVALPEVGGWDEVRRGLGRGGRDHAAQLGVEACFHRAQRATRRPRRDRGRGGEGRGRGGDR